MNSYHAKSAVLNLGKPTLRGVRRCPKCGTVNGTRGSICKNKTCRASFIRPVTNDGSLIASGSQQIGDSLLGTRRVGRISPQAVRINTGISSNEQVYSVRVRDRGPDNRGFVQLPNLSNTTTDHAEVTSVAIARCFVDTCVRFASESDEVQPHSCRHVKATLTCDVEAVPLALKNTVLNGLQVASEIKQAVWSLATESPGPLVQRISKTVMVVKCKIDSRYPLGFLHFFIADNVSGGQRDYRDACTCKEFSTSRTDEQRRCIHFYACVCAFASDEKLSKEFSQFLRSAGGNAAVDKAPQDVAISTKSWEMFVVTPEITSSAVFAQILKTSLGETDDVPSNYDDIAATATIQRTCLVLPAEPPVVGSESASSLSFVNWLGSVTERVNQTMYYGSCGRPEPLVFLVPQAFFDCLQQRIAAGAAGAACNYDHGNKKDTVDTDPRKTRRLPKWRLPNITTVFERVDAPPLGVFTKYAWHIKNASHVKNILDTPHIQLEVIRFFTESHDGTYEVQATKYPVDGDHLRSDSNHIAIRPVELKTFLKVGCTSTTDREPIPFIFEWIPDILPKSKIGELSLKFQYGHQRNGQIEDAHTVK